MQNAILRGIKLRVAGIVPESIVDGPGIRMSIFTQGCPHHCKGCHNPETHDFEGGYLEDLEAIMNTYDDDPLLQGMTFSGGEPFCQADKLALLAKEVKRKGGDIMVFTGWTLKELTDSKGKGIFDLLSLTDYLVDGPYIESLRDLNLLYRGSSNQNFIHMKDLKGRMEQGG